MSLKELFEQTQPGTLNQCIRADLNKVITLFSGIHDFETENVQPMVSPLTQGIQSRQDIAEHQNLQSQFSEFCPHYEKEHCIVPIVIE